MNKSGLESIPKFNYTNGAISQVNKTGLGSSAAMVTAVVASLLRFFGIVECESSAFMPEDMAIIEKIAHCCHCIAQGKIGSGFDISSACHGSHSYKRFSPLLISELLEEPNPSASLISKIVDAKYVLFN